MQRPRNIVFYTPVNFRCRDIESLAKKYAEEGNQVALITQCEEGALHQSFKNLGLQAFVLPEVQGGTLLKTYRKLKQLIRFLKKHKTDLLFSHLEPTNFVSVVSQFFVKTKVVIYRHHIDVARLQGFDASLTYRLTYQWARKIISVSEQGKQYMMREENVNPDKIVHINLGYDFSLYAYHAENVKAIRAQYGQSLLLVFVGSLVSYKRPELAVELVQRAVKQGLDVKLLMLGKGEAEEELKNIVNHSGLQERIHFIGYAAQILDYLGAADLLIHPSVSESSCVVIKEASLVDLPVVVCNGVGDFDDYIQNGVNAIALEKDNFVEECLVHVKRYSENPEFYKEIGRTLKQEIRQRFSIENTFPQYKKILNNG